MHVAEATRPASDARAYRTLDALDPRGKRVLVRVDLNVPVQDGAIADETRLERILPTIRHLSDNRAMVVLLSHFGRPKVRNVEDTLRPVAAALALALGRRVRFVDDCIGEPVERALRQSALGDIVCLENTRFHAGEEANDREFVAALAKNGDAYVNDAFSTAHRAHASTEGLAHVLPAYAGLGMQAELDALEAGLGRPVKPVTAIVGGSKVSTKLDLLTNLIARVDTLIIGGGMANTFLAAQGHDVGNSLCEHDLAPTARMIMAKAKSIGCTIQLPLDAICARKFAAGAPSRIAALDDVRPEEMILDMGPRSIDAARTTISASRTLIWNGPFGAFELAPFDAGTNAVAQHAAMLTRQGRLISVGGGGDTVSALNKSGAGHGFTYISTAGGAFLEWMEGKTLPGIAALMSRP